MSMSLLLLTIVLLSGSIPVTDIPRTEAQMSSVSLDLSLERGDSHGMLAKQVEPMKKLFCRTQWDSCLDTANAALSSEHCWRSLSSNCTSIGCSSGAHLKGVIPVVCRAVVEFLLHFSIILWLLSEHSWCKPSRSLTHGNGPDSPLLAPCNSSSFLWKDLMLSDYVEIIFLTEKKGQVYSEH